MLFPMVLARPHRWFRIALVATLASVAGGLLGYGIGFALWEVVARPVIDWYGLTEPVMHVREQYEDHGVLVVLLGGLTPLPYKAVTLASGAAGMDVMWFALASIAGRGLRFFAEAAVLSYFGPPVEALVRRHAVPVTLLFGILLVGGFVVFAYWGSGG